MRARLRSTRARLLMAAFGSAILALTLLTVNPFPSDVLGQATAPVPSAPATASVAPGATVTVGGVTVVNQSSQPANVQLQGNMLTIAAPAGFTVVVEGASCAPVDGQTNVVTCTVAPGARVTFTSVAGVSRQPAPSAPAPAAPQPAAPRPAAPQAPAVAPAPVPQRPAVSAAEHRRAGRGGKRPNREYRCRLWPARAGRGARLRGRGPQPAPAVGAVITAPVRPATARAARAHGYVSYRCFELAPTPDLSQNTRAGRARSGAEGP
jgi:hypothetical protein